PRQLRRARRGAGAARQAVPAHEGSVPRVEPGPDQGRPGERAPDPGGAAPAPVPDRRRDAAGPAAGPRALPSGPEVTPRRQGQSFAEILATELRRAPWLGASLLLHAAFFLLLSLVARVQPPAAGIVLSMRGAEQGEEAVAGDADSPPEPTADPMSDPLL